MEIHKTNDEDGEKCDKRPKMDSNPPSMLEVTRMQTEGVPNNPNDSELSRISSSPPLRTEPCNILTIKNKEIENNNNEDEDMD
jgi:hypothetical protein